MTKSHEPPKRKSKSLQRLGWSSLAVAGSLGLLGLARHQLQQSHLFGKRSRTSPDQGYKPSGSLAFEDVTFRSEDGTLLHGWWIEQPRARATILYCHGRSHSLAYRAQLYRHFRRRGFNVFTFDYRGYGRSAGQPSEKGLFADVRAAIDVVVGPLGVDPRALLLFGHSLGGAVAVDGALNRPVAGLIVESSFTDLHDMARRVSRLPLHLLTRNGFRNIEKVQRLYMPKLFIHGTADTTVPLDMGERLFAAAAEPKQWYAVPEADHNDLHRHDLRRYFRTLEAFGETCLATA